MEIRDPIHGSLDIPDWIIPILQSLPVQRLRQVRALGFAELIYPGATHNRYLHSLGVFWITHQLMTQFQSRGQLSMLNPEHQEGLKRVVCIAALCHDLGHPPFSHALEPFAPQGHHEFMSFRLCEEFVFPLAAPILQPFGLKPSAILSALGAPQAPTNLMLEGIDTLPLLQAILWGECDVDRMDYLLRDSYFCGVSYGQFDQPWLCSHLRPQVLDNRLLLVLQERALGSFEDFLLSRLHMFQLVYCHHGSVLAEHLAREMLRDLKFSLPTEPQAYLSWTDARVWDMLQQHPQVSQFPRGYKLLLEETTQPIPEELVQQLPPNTLRLKTEIQLARKKPQVLLGTGHGTLVPLERRSLLLEKYKEPLKIDRLYLPQDDQVSGFNEAQTQIAAYYRQ